MEKEKTVEVVRITRQRQILKDDGPVEIDMQNDHTE